MNDIQIFENADFGQIRTMNDDAGNAWFVGKDVADVLGYSKPLNAIAMHVDEDDSLKQGLIDSLGRVQQTIFINESGLYSLVFASKLPRAREFKHWVTSVVLPQIRRTGGYIPVGSGDDDSSIMAKALLIAQRTIEQKEALLIAQAPSVEFAAAVTATDDSILVRDLAKLITQNGIPIGQTRLFCWLRLHGYLFKNELRPMQKWVEKGLFATSISIIQTHHGSIERITTRVTGKGQRYFLDGFLSGRFR